MAGRRKIVAVLAAVIAVLLSGAVAGIARTEPDTVGVSTTAGPEPATAEAEVAAQVAGASAEVAPTTLAPAPATTPGPSLPAPSTTKAAGGTKATVRSAAPAGRDEVGSAADLRAGAIQSTTPGRCTPTSEPTPPHAIAVVELRLGCVRSLVPAGTWAGPEVSWSPDGSWLLTTVEGRVTRLARDGSWRQDLGGGGQATVALLSPDGARMAVVGLVPSIRRKALVVASVDGTAVTVVEQVEQMMMRPPTWSLDSQVLAVVSKDSPFDADVVRVVGADGRVRASRTFPDRALHSSNGGPLSPGPASLGKPVFMPDGRLFLPAFVELPRRQTGLWLNRGLADVAGLEPPSDLMFADGVSVPGDGSKIVYVGAYAPPSLALPIRRIDLRTGETVTLASDGAVPSASHRMNAVAYVTRSPQQTPTGLSMVDASGVTRPAWRHTGIGCVCVRSGIPAWTPDDTAVAIAT